MAILREIVAGAAAWRDESIPELATALWDDVTTRTIYHRHAICGAMLKTKRT
jgi:hypothetical protein